MPLFPSSHPPQLFLKFILDSTLNLRNGASSALQRRLSSCSIVRRQQQYTPGRLLLFPEAPYRASSQSLVSSSAGELMTTSGSCIDLSLLGIYLWNLGSLKYDSTRIKQVLFTNLYPPFLRFCMSTGNRALKASDSTSSPDSTKG